MGHLLCPRGITPLPRCQPRCPVQAMEHHSLQGMSYLLLLLLLFEMAKRWHLIQLHPWR